MKKCGYCGRDNVDEAANCLECGTEFENLNTPPIVKLTTAGFWIRALARIIDTFSKLLLGFSAGILVLIPIAILNATGHLPSGWQHRIRELSLISIGFSFLGNFLYHFFCEGIHGATLGKLCCGIRVVSEDGKPSNLKGALIRTLGFYVDGLFFGLVGYDSMRKSPLNQRYGDVWGKTAVFKNSEIAPELQRTPMHFILGFFLGAGGLVIMLVIGLVCKVL
ncbi:MAG: RDD family protein [Verrucomicrobiota bacterium]